MERIVAAVKPHWLKAYRRNEIPEVSMQEDPNFYHSILRVNSKVLGSISKNETSSEVINYLILVIMKSSCVVHYKWISDKHDFSFLST